MGLLILVLKPRQDVTGSVDRINLTILRYGTVVNSEFTSMGATAIV